MKRPRNVTTLSNLDLELEEWAKEEAKRRGKPFYQVINEALKVLRLAREGAEKGELREVGEASGPGPSLN